MKRYFIIFITLILFCSSCFNNVINEETIEKDEVTQEIISITSLPEKEIPDSPLANESPLSADNIDDYLFLEDVLYIDLRSFSQQQSEGSIAGFKVIPFYEVIVWWEKQDNVLFTMSKPNDNYDSYLGDVGSFIPNYEESIHILENIFPRDKQIVFISTAGVEAAYMINLLTQYGYDASLLYNAGTFTNGIGNTTAYMNKEDHKYYIKGDSSYELEVTFNWGELTPINP